MKLNSNESSQSVFKKFLTSNPIIDKVDQDFQSFYQANNNNNGFNKYKNKIPLIVALLVLCTCFILMNIENVKKPEKITKKFECLKEKFNPKESSSNNNHEILKKNYLQKLNLYDSSADLIKKLSESLHRLNYKIDDDELREKIHDNHFESFIKNVKFGTKDALNTSQFLDESFSYKKIGKKTKKFLNAIENKHFKFAGLMIKHIFQLTTLTKKELNKAKIQITSLENKSNKINSLIDSGILKLPSNVNYNLIIYITILLVLTRLFIVYNKIKLFKEFAVIILVCTFFYFLYQFQFANKKRITFKIQKINRQIELSSLLIDEVDNIHNQYCCELSKMEIFINSKLLSIDQQKIKITQIITKISKEKSNEIKYGKSSAQYLLDANVDNLMLLTSTNYPPEINEQIKSLNEFIFSVVYDTVMCFSNVKSICEETAKLIDFVKSLVNETRIFNLNVFLNWVIDINKDSLNQVKPLIEYLGNQFKSADNIVTGTEIAIKENNSKTDFKTTIKKLVVAGVTVLLGGGTPKSIGKAIIDYFKGNIGLNEENQNLLKAIKEKSDQFSTHIKNLYNILLNYLKNLSKTMSFLVELQKKSKNWKRDESEMIENKNKELILHSFILNDIENKIVIDSLDSIRMKNDELLSLIDTLKETFKIDSN